MSIDTGLKRNAGHKFGEEVTSEERQLLFTLASQVPEDEVIIVFGRREGDIIVSLAKGTAVGNRSRVYSIKPRLYIAEDKTTDEENTDTWFISKLEEAGVRNLVDISCIDSGDTQRKWRKSIGLLVMHLPAEYSDIKAIFMDWERHLSTNSKVVIGNSDRTGPTRVLTEVLGNLGDFQFEGRTGNLTVIRIDECTHHWLINANEDGICKLCRRERNFKKLMKETDTAGLRRRIASRSSVKKRISSTRKNKTIV